MDGIIGFICLLAFSALCAWGAYVGFKERKRVNEEYNKAVTTANQQKEDAITTNKPRMRAKYNSIRSGLNIPSNCSKIDVETTVFGLPCKAQALCGKRTLLKNDFYCWNEDNTLYIFPTEEHLEDEHITYATLPKDLGGVLNPNDIRVYRIHKDEIKHYQISGQERSEVKVHSADDGVNVKGAIIGGILAGDAGAVIGSQHNKGRIYSNTEHFDERFVELYYSQNGTTSKLKLSITAYPLLEQWYPDKEYSYVLSATPQSSTTNGDKFDEVKKYKELLDSGIISEAEFEAKRKELLGL